MTDHQNEVLDTILKETLEKAGYKEDDPEWKLIIDFKLYSYKKTNKEIKNEFPHYVPFGSEINKRAKEEKEARHKEWRNTYAECIKLFGDKVRG